MSKFEEIKEGDLVEGFVKLPYPGLEEVRGLVVDVVNFRAKVLTQHNEFVWVDCKELEVVQKSYT